MGRSKQAELAAEGDLMHTQDYAVRLVHYGDGKPRLIIQAGPLTLTLAVTATELVKLADRILNAVGEAT